MYSSILDLEVWKECRKMRHDISNLVKKFTLEEKYKLTVQILRSSQSPCANISKGQGRFHYQENIQFWRIAKGSITETYNHLTNGIIDIDEFNQLANQIDT